MRPPPAEGEVHVWKVSARRPPERLAAVAGSLTRGELRRARRFLRAADRRRFLVGRWALRSLLGGWLGVEARSVPLAFGASGKPALAEEVESDLTFNVAHSGEWVMIAAARGFDVGVDVERMRRLSDGRRIARRFFARREADVLVRLPRPVRRRAFYACWTRKEAFVKAVGEGLSFPLGRFEVTLDPKEPAALLSIDGSRAAAAEWTLWSIPPGDGYEGAVVARSPGARLFLWSWTAAGIVPWR